jgi:hypothetical protein
MDFNQAKRKIRRAWLISAIAIPAFYGSLFLGRTIKLPFLHLFMPWQFPGVMELPVLLIVLFLTWMVYRKIRAGAVLLLIFYILNRAFTYMWLVHAPTDFMIVWWCFSVLWGFILFQGIRGTIAYHQLNGQTSTKSDFEEDHKSPAGAGPID